MTLKVGFDISQTAHSGGVAVYTQNLAQQLIRDKSLKMKFFYSSLRKPFLGKLPEVRSYPLPPTALEILFNQFRIISIENLIGEVDVFHSSDWTQPKTKAKKVTTYHDVVPLKFPQWSHPKIIKVHRRRLALVEKEIDMIIAVSEATKKDLLEISSLPEEKITVIYEAAGEQFKPQEKSDIEEFRKKMKLPENFVLAVGGVGERRNLSRVREAAKNYNLVITRQDLPEIPDSEMPLLYSAATVLLYPSYYEGFGLPILEAMSCGTPVITANISSMPEVGGDACVYVDPLKVEDMNKKLKEVMEDSKLRDSLIQKGFQQAKKFSWQKTAEQTLKVYQNLCPN